MKECECLADFDTFPNGCCRGCGRVQITRGADFSEDKLFRFVLTRWWTDDLPSMTCVLLNPSTADATNDDPTNRKVLKWAIANNYGSLAFVNLFAWRSPSPAAMKKIKEPIGEGNDSKIKVWMNWGKIIVAGWGIHGPHMNRDKEVLAMNDLWHCFGITKHGYPRHPLYMRDSTVLQGYPYGPRPGE